MTALHPPSGPRAWTALATMAALLVAPGCRPQTEVAARAPQQHPPATKPTSAAPEAGATTTAEDLQAPLLSGMGDYHRAIDTETPLAQRLFDQGMVLHFGFNHAEAVRSFEEALRLDSDCAMCAMGIALSLGPNINAPMDPDNAHKAHQAAQKALKLSGDTPQADRALIEAVAERYSADSPEDRTPLDEAYAEAIGNAASEHPEDHDIATLHGEALMILHAWDYWKPDGAPKPWTPKILRVLERTLEQVPQHPFANHLYIHAVEASDEPERALPNAKRLEDLVPGAGHLVHMPSHIYIRTGDYHEASLANERAVAADERYLAEVQAQGLYPLAYYPHNYHFLWATTTLEGRSADALEAARAVAKRADREKMRKPGFGTLQHYLSIPYYALVAFGQWDAILDEPKPPVELPYPNTVWHYARGMALANKGRLDRAHEALERVERAAEGDRLQDVTIWDINSTADLMKIAANLLAAEIAAAQGKTDAAITHLEQAVVLEDRLNYDEPPPWGPATRRYLGAALLEGDRPKAAERVYREDLERFPENGWSLLGLMQSLRARGKVEAARAVQARFRKAWKHADLVLTRSRL